MGMHILNYLHIVVEYYFDKQEMGWEYIHLLL